MDIRSFLGKRKIGLILVFFACLLPAIEGFASPGDADLARKIRALEKKANATFGISAIYIEKDKVFNYNSHQHFFMASTIKLPIAMTFLDRVDRKKDSLNRTIRMDVHNTVPGSGALHYLFRNKPLKISMKQVLTHMMTKSDNSASDALLHAVNGPKNVTKRMQVLGFNDIKVNRSILEMMMDTNQVSRSYLRKPQSVEIWKRMVSKVPLKTKSLAWQKFQNDTRDTTTPDEMAKLLAKLYDQKALSASSTHLLIDIMEKCHTGRNRIKGMLPNTVKVAHKTGTWSIDEPNYIRYPAAKNLYRFTSDVGIITLPKNKGHVAIAIYVKSKSARDYTRSRAIAQISRVIYDHFMKA